jgi:UDP-arabinose 4-epimerase
MSERVLVTGGAGYIGSHTAKALAEAGLEPVVLDDLSRGHERDVRFGPFVHGSILDGDLVRRTAREYRVKGVVHFAGLAYVGESMEDPAKYFHHNVTGTLTLVDALRSVQQVPVVFSSSCATYGHAQSVPISEDHPQHPLSPYGESKLFVERVLHWYGHCYGMPWKALRYFNAAGADPDGQLGEDHDPETHLIPRAIAAALGTGPGLSIYGTDYPTHDGTCVRDFIHVTDLAEGHVQALRHLMDGGASGALNLGAGTGHTVWDVVRTVQEVGGKDVPLERGPRREGDAAELVADTTRARSDIGFDPQRSTLRTIVETAWYWHARR